MCREMTDYRNPSPPSSPTRSPPDPQASPCPRELQISGEEGDPDRIAGTVFSRSWVLALLVRAVQYASSQSEESACSPQECTGKDRSEESSKVNSHQEGEKSSKVNLHEDTAVVEGKGCISEDGGGDMDAVLEEELCLLWDASMNSVRCNQDPIIINLQDRPSEVHGCY